MPGRALPQTISPRSAYDLGWPYQGDIVMHRYIGRTAGDHLGPAEAPYFFLYGSTIIVHREASSCLSAASRSRDLKPPHGCRMPGRYITWAKLIEDLLVGDTEADMNAQPSPLPLLIPGPPCRGTG